MIRKRVFSLMMVVVLVFFCVRPVPVQASSVAVPSAEVTEEVLMLLWNLMVNGMYAAGATEAIGDYEAERSAFEQFIDILNDVMGIPTTEDFVVYLQDGTAVCLSDIIDGTGALVIPDEGTFAKYRLLDGGGAPEPDPDPEEPEDPKPSPWEKVQSFIIGSQFLYDVASFMAGLWDGEYEALNPADYYAAEEFNWSGNYEMLDGNYIFTGNMTEEWPEFTSSTAIHFLKIAINQNMPEMPAIVCSTNTDGSQLFSFYRYSNGIRNLNLYFYSYGYNITGKLLGTYGNSNVSYWKIKPEHAVVNYNFNIPVFGTYEAMENFFITGDDTGVLNGLCFDFPMLAAGVLETLAPLTGINLDPAALLELIAALNQGLAAYPLPGLSPAEQTEAYQDAAKNIVIEHAVPVPDPLPDPGPKPEPEPDPEPAPGEDGEVNIDNYKRNLSMIFPFCLPFDFIHLLQAFDAEPKAPAFDIPFVVPALDINMTVTLDMSFLNPVMEIWRFGEKVGFVFLLIFVTSKVIRW